MPTITYINDDADRGQGDEAEQERVRAAAEPSGAPLGGGQHAARALSRSVAGAHRAAISAWGAACLMRVVSHSSCRPVSPSQAATTSSSSGSRSPCPAWPTTVQVMSTNDASV